MTDILSLPNWAALSITESDDTIIYAEYLIQPDKCPKCGSDQLYKHGTKPVIYRDIPRHMKPTVINVEVKRYRCKSCKATFLQEVTGIYPDTRMTERFVKKIQDICLDYTFSDTARMMGCDSKTIRTITNDLIEIKNKSHNPELSGWIGLDETEIDGNFRFVVTDIIHKRPIEMLESRDKDTVSRFLWKYRDKDIQGFSIDMWRPYKTLINLIFPKAIIVIDKFHVLKMANKALDDIRIKLARNQPAGVGKLWMRKKYQLRTRRQNLNEQELYNLDMWLENEPDLAKAYYIKETIFAIYDIKTREEAEPLFNEWLNLVPPEFRKSKKDFLPLYRAIKNWRKDILSYFDHRVTNAYTEALNGVAKTYNHSGRGYSFEVLRARVLFSRKHKVLSNDEIYYSRTGGADLRVSQLKNGIYVCEFCSEVYEPTNKSLKKINQAPNEVQYLCPEHGVELRFIKREYE
ncbi:transposase [Acinetobacter junii SH205]|uniref:Transposase n=1 Tax=Acinetobacter junii SH205 TaxID=575587 RepID=D0SJK4_ACIJU|nr:ISL3 family transposase [Acinetobacter junii]EEY94026.1 transposase [Acinetobacter junii SH205]